jgi:hypothetical protein
MGHGHSWETTNTIIDELRYLGDGVERALAIRVVGHELDVLVLQIDFVQRAAFPGLQRGALGVFEVEPTIEHQN